MNTQLLDPNHDDETHCEGSVTVVVKDDGGPCFVRKTGRYGLELDSVQVFVKQASERRNDLLVHLNK